MSISIEWAPLFAGSVAQWPHVSTVKLGAEKRAVWDAISQRLWCRKLSISDNGLMSVT